MRKYISILVLAISCFALNAQTLSKADEGAINKRFKEFLTYTSQQNFEKVLGYLHPKQFENGSSIGLKEMAQFLQLMKIKLDISEAKIGNLEGLSAQSGNQYALADYLLDMKMILNEQNKGFADQIVGAMKGQFGSNNVSYDASTYTIKAKGTKYVIWVKEKSLGNEWYLVDFDPKSPMTWKNIVPEKVINEASSKIK